MYFFISIANIIQYTAQITRSRMLSLQIRRKTQKQSFTRTFYVRLSFFIALKFATKYLTNLSKIESSDMYWLYTIEPRYITKCQRPKIMLYPKFAVSVMFLTLFPSQIDWPFHFIYIAKCCQMPTLTFPLMYNCIFIE